MPSQKTKNKIFARTKIVCTLGPSSESKSSLEKMITAGMDVVRLNFSHNSQEWHKETFNKIRSVSDEITILFDLQGPKIRLGELSDAYVLTQGDEFILTTEEIIGDNKRATISLKSLPRALKKKDLIFINDG
ncbi:MAG: pyruvate kinase, partial [Candidatus Heimdallarchaeota archaeon]|nr:pyruvate kinase [Candidatus Heimdallarchaeota archaeon]